jgi:hypothetical protein
MADLRIHNIDASVVAGLKARTRALDLRALAERIAAMTPELDQTGRTGLLRDDRR